MGHAQIEPPRIVVVSHKECWTEGSVVYSTGGFPAQMSAVGSLGSVVVVAPRASPKPGGAPIDGVGLITLPTLRGSGWRRRARSPLWVARTLPLLVSRIRRGDLAYCLVPGDVGLVGVVAAWIARKPLVVRHCGTWQAARTPAERLLNLVLQRVSHTAVVLATGWDPSSPPSGSGEAEWIFSSSYWERELQRIDARDGAPVTLPRLRLATAGRQVAEKGTPCCIRALPELVEKGLDPVLEVIGDGPELEVFRLLARESGVADRVTFTGRVSSTEVVDHLRDADLFVFPTTSNEGFPKVVAEAMACGLPVVSTPVSALRHVVPGAGVLIERNDPHELADAVSCLARDCNRYRTASREARERAAGFTLDRWAERFSVLVEHRFPELKFRSTSGGPR